MALLRIKRSSAPGNAVDVIDTSTNQRRRRNNVTLLRTRPALDNQETVAEISMPSFLNTTDNNAKSSQVTLHKWCLFGMTPIHFFDAYDRDCGRSSPFHEQPAHDTDKFPSFAYLANSGVLHAGYGILSYAPPSHCNIKHFNWMRSNATLTAYLKRRQGFFKETRNDKSNEMTSCSFCRSCSSTLLSQGSKRANLLRKNIKWFIWAELSGDQLTRNQVDGDVIHYLQDWKYLLLKTTFRLILFQNSFWPQTEPNFVKLNSIQELNWKNFDVAWLAGEKCIK